MTVSELIAVLQDAQQQTVNAYDFVPVLIEYVSEEGQCQYAINTLSFVADFTPTGMLRKVVLR